MASSERGSGGSGGSLDDVLPRRFFQRVDESDDAGFYAAPRFVKHVDDATIAALTRAYRDLVPAGARVLDLMSSWVSHLPGDVAYARVAGHGMSAAELARNPRLDERLVRDLNRAPELPLAGASLDAALCAFSTQYLTRPLAVFSSVPRLLAPGGRLVVAISHRMFPTKAIAIWHPLDMADRARLVGTYFRLAGGGRSRAPRTVCRSGRTRWWWSRRRELDGRGAVARPTAVRYESGRATLAQSVEQLIRNQ